MGNPFWHLTRPTSEPAPSSAAIIESMESLWREMDKAPAPDFILCNDLFLDVLTNARVVRRWRGRKYVTRPFAKLFKRSRPSG